mgnify:CR=1 FL=1|tara:strand:+ start:1935 stop:2156 length:222 start_codon:yes stop_codon:yes gene_type:complete
MTISELNNLLNTGIQVYWINSMYEVKRENSGNLIILCRENGSVSGLDYSHLEECGINKYDMRESGLYQFNLIR